jgi:hypothetical protein
MLIPDKVDFHRREKEGHFILIKGAIPQKEMTINLHACNVGVHTSPNIHYLKTQIEPDTGSLHL